MVGWDVAVHPLAGERFSVVLIDEQGHVMKTPDVGHNPRGSRLPARSYRRSTLQDPYRVYR